MSIEAPPSGPFAKLREILGMIRFSHTLFALPFALLGAAMAASGHPTRPGQWLGILICMVTARSAAMAFNRLVDRHLDARNPRTAARHLPSGRLSVRSVAVFTLANAAMFIGATALFLPGNPWPILLSVPVLLWLLGYSYAKRFTSLAHYWLGAALAMAPIAAWIAIRGELSWPPLLLGLAVLCWVGGFDIIYACQDAGFDRSSGLRSIPARLGIGGALRLAAASHAAMVAALVALGLTFPPFGWVYWGGVVVVGVMLAVEHSLVRPDDLARVNVAFFQVNIGISLGLLMIGLVDLAV
jgi:4-hydroxybenzoate polyprenyltransferase